MKQAGTLVADGLGGLTGDPDTDAGSTIANYRFDAIGRMVNKQVSNSGDLDTVGSGDFFYYDGHRAIEHHEDDGSGALSLHRQYIYGLDYIDEVVAFNDEVGDRHFVLQDANYNVISVTDAGGKVEQQYSYKPYGGRLAAETVSFDLVSFDITVTDIDLSTEQDQLATTKGHQGLDHLPEIDAINNRNRILKPVSLAIIPSERAAAFRRSCSG